MSSGQRHRSEADGFEIVQAVQSLLGLARYWGSSACSSRMENGTMEPGGEGGGREGQEESRTQGLKMVNSGVVLIEEVWLVQVAEWLNLQLSVLEEVQLGQEGEPHKPQLEYTNTHPSVKGIRH
ncbi:hypothetical protein F7725_007797 [Dissostichus mawsoni]|uniref:Uncharacterized protein n=1 Tax=Dissostichus mawsoni TaxID=36200 RepID=A0A7J5Y5C8_DISMA|nr:hypothetical protein F7725_007797 [Dissostichus mawsoni]